MFRKIVDSSGGIPIPGKRAFQGLLVADPGSKIVTVVEHAEMAA